MRLLLATLLALTTLRGLAATIVVTSNADSGPGSLRDAITQAIANGGTNTITFNIADQSRAGRTITLASALPQLPSNLTIDGTTQPGARFGISYARIIITNPRSGPYLNYFVMIGVSNVQIYGLFLQSISGGYGFYFRECSNLTFGAAFKGNIVQGFGYAIYCDFISSTEPGSSNVTIQGNIMGTDETGTSAGYQEFNQNGLYFRNVSNLQIGGLNPGEGNLMNVISIPMDYTDTRNIDFGYLNFQGNKVGTDITGNTRLSPNYEAVQINGYNNGDGSNFSGTTTLAVNITNNISACGYDLFEIASYFYIQGNHIGVGPDNTSNIINDGYNGEQAGIWLTFCGHGLIGGPAPGDKNYIANFIQWGVFEAYSGNITVSQNSIFCNGTGIVPSTSKSYVNITLLNTGTVGGTAPPNSIIELFYDDECPGCEGKTYIGTTTADASGNWSYSLTATGAIVATATDVNGATSAFSTATINTTNVVVTNATCERTNGSIKNIQVTSGTEWQWLDANGNIVGTNTDLTNVGPGTYTFVTSIGGASCNASSTPYTITSVDLPGLDPTAITPTQPTCGQNNGALAYAGTFDPSTTYSWLDGAGTTVCPDYSAADPLTKLSAGTYTLQLALKQDPTCFTKYGPFSLSNQSGPSMTTTDATITYATCGLSNGSITGISYQNATAPLTLLWQDANDVGHGYGADLTHAYGGTYRLALKDGSTCDTIFSPWYTIPDNGVITYDTTKLVYTQATCDLSNGALTGITVTGATTFTWMNGNGDVVGTTLDISGLGPGPYELSLSDVYGCQLSIIPPFTIRQLPMPAFDYSRLQIYSDTCNSGVGAIKDLVMADTTLTYSWDWYSPANPNDLVGNGAGFIDNVHAGSYVASVTDKYNCTVKSNSLKVPNVDLSPPLPQITGAITARNTPATLTITNPQTGEYLLLDGPSYGATILDSSATGILQTPDIPQDETLYVGFMRGDCSTPMVPVNIKVFDSVRVFVPNAFTPNGDGNNDTWRITIQGLTHKIQISVYDRWGAMVFSSNDPGMAWDGTAGGHPLSGTFVYMIGGVDYFNKPFLLKGTLMIIR
jgi:gliding motility-associated-like protein